MGENQTDMTYDHALQPWWNGFNVCHNIMLSTIDVFVIVGNIVTLITLARYKELQYQRNLLIASLSLSDLSVGICGLVAAVIDVIRNNRLAHMWNRGIYLSAIVAVEVLGVVTRVGHRSCTHAVYHVYHTRSLRGR